MVDEDKFFKILGRVPGKHYQHKTDNFIKGERSQKTFAVDMLEELIPIPYDVLLPIAKIYNMVWKDKYLLCPKHDYAAVGVKSKSLLDNTPQYTISKHFLSTEFRRTHSPMLKKAMKFLLVFDDVIAEVEKSKRDYIEKLVYRDKYIKSRVLDFGEGIDETY